MSQHFTTRKRKRLLVTLLFEIILQGQQCVDSISMIGRKYLTTLALKILYSYNIHINKEKVVVSGLILSAVMIFTL